MTNLTKLKTGDRCSIRSIKGDSRYISRITSIGLSLGSNVQVVRNGFGMPMLLFVHDTLIALSKKEARKIDVNR